jgi:hypothetical protein
MEVKNKGLPKVRMRNLIGKLLFIKLGAKSTLISEWW